MTHCFFQFNFTHHHINSAHVSQIILQSSNHNFIFLIAHLLFPSQFVPLYSHIHVSFLLSHSCCLHHNCFVSFLTHFITFHTVGHFLFIHILFYWHIFCKTHFSSCSFFHAFHFSVFQFFCHIYVSATTHLHLPHLSFLFLSTFLFHISFFTHILVP